MLNASVTSWLSSTIRTCALNRGRVEGQREKESAPFAQLALDPDRARVQLDQLARDGEPEAGSVMGARRGRIDLRELAKHQLVMVARYSASGVPDLDDELLTAFAAAREADPDPTSVAA